MYVSKYTRMDERNKWNCSWFVFLKKKKNKVRVSEREKMERGERRDRVIARRSWATIRITKDSSDEETAEARAEERVVGREKKFNYKHRARARR